MGERTMCKNKKQLNGWIEEMHSRGYWATPCWAQCGEWFAQERRLRGKRAFLCPKVRCRRARYYATTHGLRLAPEWMRAKWIEQYGDTEYRYGKNPKPRPRAELQEAA